MKHRFLSAVVITMFVFGCKKPVSPLAEFIPKDAAAIFMVDVNGIKEKINSSGITIDSLVDLLSDEETEMPIRWSEITNSGIDLKVPFFIFSDQNNSIQNGNTANFGLVAQIENEGKLVDFLKKHNQGAEVKQDSKYQYMDLKNGYVAGWKNNILIISGSTHAGAGSDEARSHQQLTTLFTQNESASIASVGEFRDMMKKTGDIHFWINASPNLASFGMLGMTKMSSLLQGTYTEGTITFEKGKAKASAETHYNKTLSDILSKYPSREIDKTLISRYPGQVNGFGVVAFNPKVLIDILQYLGFDTMADGYLSEAGFTTTDVVNAFKGDIGVIFSDFRIEEGTIPTMPGINAKRPAAQFLLNAVIGDRAAFNRVMNGLVKQRVLTKNGDQYQLGIFGGHDFVIEATPDNLFIASDDALIKAYESSNNKSALSADVEKEINGKSTAMYVDIEKLLDTSRQVTVHNSYAFSDSGKTWQAAKSTFKNFIGYTEKGDGKTTTSAFELNTVNQNENSLASLVKFIAVAHHDWQHRTNVGIHPPLDEDSIQRMPDIPQPKSSD
ncbi:MAG TPA: DUF4836 family protein [Parafilimonas sp.]|nr:DUF4836 family protein [Parafilimonas sp.]